MAAREFNLRLDLKPQDVKRVQTLRRNVMDYLLIAFIWCGTVFAWFVLCAVLNGVLGDNFGTVLVAAAFSLLLRWGINHAIAQHDARLAEKTARGFEAIDVAINPGGLKLIAGRSVTSYGWEDFVSIVDHGELLELDQKSGPSLFLPGRIFPDQATYSECASFIRDEIERAPSGTA